LSFAYNLCQIELMFLLFVIAGISVKRKG